MGNSTIAVDYAAEAQRLAGNWRKFDSFAWHRQYECRNPDQWTVVYTVNRDSRLREESNAAVYELELERFTRGPRATVVPERHTHWACGWVDGYSIKVYCGNATGGARVTKAFKAYCDLRAREQRTGVLDDDDYTRREHEATLANVYNAAWQLEHEYDLPAGWAAAVEDWLLSNMEDELVSQDDEGGYPSEAALRAAFDALGYLKQETTSV